MTTPIPPPAPQASAAARPDDVLGARVLVVDDEPLNLAVLERVLQGAGFTDVATVADPAEAVAVVAEDPPDLVLLDLHMPTMDGFDVLESIEGARVAQGFLPVLVLTADVTTQARDRALTMGANDFLTKPFDATEVVLRVTNLLRTRALHTEVQRHNAALQADLDAHLAAQQAAADARRQRVDRLRALLSEGRLSMRFQPITDLRDGTVAGLEALARFTDTMPRTPDEWFAEAAEVGMAEVLELAAVRLAVAALDRMPAGAFLSVNVSPEVAVAPALVDLLAPVPGDRLVVELTEHQQVADPDALLAALDRLRRRGIRLAVDDAGSGHSGLQQLLRLRPDVVKLDMALTRGLDHDPARRALTTAMLGFAEEIGSTIIAEGVETPEELAALRALGVRFGQGFHLARPARL